MVYLAIVTMTFAIPFIHHVDLLRLGEEGHLLEASHELNAFFAVQVFGLT